MTMNLHAALLSASLVLSQATLAAGPNLARNRPCKASSVEGQLTPEKAVDGPKSQASRWGSNYGTDKNKDSAWIWVDLGAAVTVDSVAIYWEHSGAKQYAVQSWTGAGAPSDNDEGWETQLTDTTLTYQNPPVDMCLSFLKLKPVSTRYIRIRCYKRLFNFGFSIMELEVYGSGTTALNLSGAMASRPAPGTFPALGRSYTADGRLVRPGAASRPAGGLPL